MSLKNFYQNLLPPENLTFDEASLFWRLRGGEGLPHRVWHRPLEKNQTWQEIKTRLDHKLNISRASTVFHQIYPPKNRFLLLMEKFLKNIKRSFLLERET